MTEPRHLDHAPIVEALVDISATLPDDFDVDRFLVAGGAIGDRFPAAEKLTLHHASITVGPGALATNQALPQPRGYLFRSADELTIAQFRRDGFTLNRLRPYSSWDSLYPLALELWELYRRIAGPITCNRVGVRYINQIDIPLMSDLTAYLTAIPRPPVDAPWYLSDFFNRVVVSDPRSDLIAAITQASSVSATSGFGIVFLDIEAFREPAAGIPFDQVAASLSALRILKNEIFFRSITDETASRYA